MIVPLLQATSPPTRLNGLSPHRPVEQLGKTGHDVALNVLNDGAAVRAEPWPQVLVEEVFGIVGVGDEEAGRDDDAEDEGESLALLTQRNVTHATQTNATHEMQRNARNATQNTQTQRTQGKLTGGAARH
jgi:hypothetical protein